MLNSMSKIPISNEDGNRLVFFDKIRYLFVFAVVLQHAGNAYFSDTWPVSDIGGSGALTAYINVLWEFLMPALFFIIINMDKGFAGNFRDLQRVSCGG